MHAKPQLKYYLHRAEQEAIQAIWLGKTEASAVHEELSLLYSLRARDMLIHPSRYEHVLADIAAWQGQVVA